MQALERQPAEDDVEEASATSRQSDPASGTSIRSPYRQTLAGSLLGVAGSVGMMGSFALLVARVLDDGEYLMAVAVSLTAYALGLWLGARLDGDFRRR